MKATMTTTTLVPVLALVAFFAHAQRAQGQPLTNSGVLQSDILTLIDPVNFPPGPPLNPPLLTYTAGNLPDEPINSLVDLQGDPGVVQSACWYIGGGLYLYGYQWECHAGPDFDILTMDVPMSGTTPVALDIDGVLPLDDSWAITDPAFDFVFMPYDQSPGGLLALCQTDIFFVDPNDFVTGAVFSAGGDIITFSNSNGVFDSSNIFGFVTTTPPKLAPTTGGFGTEFGTTVVGTLPFTVVAPSNADCSDFPCGNKGNKVQICHVPPGNPGSANTLCISPNAVPAHLANHPGDHCGPCETGLLGP